MKTITLLMIIILLTGCYGLKARFQPDDVAVAEMAEGEDCARMVLGIGFGTADLEEAKRQATLVSDNSKRRAITKVRRVELIDFYLLLVGGKCVRVVGE